MLQWDINILFAILETDKALNYPLSWERNLGCRNSPAFKVRLGGRFIRFVSSKYQEASGYADVSIVNLLGMQLAHLFSGEVGAGEHSFTWDAAKMTAPRGMYECLVRMNGQVETLPVVVAH